MHQQLAAALLLPEASLAAEGGCSSTSGRLSLDVFQQAAAEIWAGTFHAFGLEILRKFGRPEDAADPLRFLDQEDVAVMLEADLPLLGIHHLRSELGYILRAISRAKDEVVSSGDYAVAAERIANSAQSEEAKREAAESAEVVRVYAHYERRLRPRDS